ncbi:UDP-3-O-(3-hydroxymyristoyl)glucosamine N-acyltransferase [Leptolyngbyaceae cyanobacterium CCMR0082]|uniref:UDP-3-O-acylglucosamine N-acyltransferase n=1 Tax=Adonisia turfae CCMR0082 TaxID=2304604 RepID=A0A6M0S7L5_9CYAN|nr:UDP-3-O-(3-hydroxymyristoyl)glucosamine N-acyltransferase [Adonisia turfae]MDV3347587.1 UDP-3-O-(3-hydroxymyristoyl)glucosamine N-acyltransferase [Leptothoe sp. LEGE 181152]NEZ64458.1 UDP-3-O-(3-hydroxymyristoyl)glucosamine N-acyltransferase [Adonisia turfae CCMR0082]
MRFSEIVEQLGIAETSSLASQPELNPNIVGVTAVQESQPDTISYVEGKKFAPYIEQTANAALILPVDEALQAQAIERGIAWVSTHEPRLGFARAIALFYQPFQLSPGIHPTAIIAPTAKVGNNVAIGPYVVIHAGATIGDNACIHPQVVIYPDASIGEGTTLHANCVIHERAQVGAHCVIHTGAVIGSEGFGFVPTAQGWEKMHQSGIVVLEDHVEVGCNTTIDRPAVGETRIGRNSKLDNLTQVAHNCQLADNCILASQVGLAGGVELESLVVLGGQVGVANNTKIGKGAQAGSKAGLHSNVSPGSIMMGIPASPYRTYLKSSAIYNRLPEMHRTLKRLQQQVAHLEEQLAQVEQTNK